MKKKARSRLFSQFMLCFSAVVILAAGSVFERAEAMKENWNEDSGGIVYINRNGSIVRNDWVSSDGDTYYMGSDSKPVKGMAVIDRKTYFFDTGGHLVTDGWFSSEGKRYYIQNGSMLKGWHTLFDQNYYFNGDGSMHTGWLKTGKGNFYLQENGTMASGWIKADGCDYLLDKQGRQQTKSYRNSDSLVIFDRFHGYAWLDLKQAANAFATLSGKDLEVFGTFTVSKEDQKLISEQIELLQKDGHQVSFMLYIPFGGGVAYNCKQPFYTASTIKGIYLSSLYMDDAGSYESYPGYFQDAIYYSDNYSYEFLYETYGDAPLQNAARMVGVKPELFHDYYADCSAAELAQLWLYNYAVLNYMDFPAELRECYEEVETAPIRDAVRPLKTQSKAGWLDEEDGAANDAGIVFTPEGPYILAVMSDHPGNTDVLKDLVSVLNKIVLSKQ
ncbi:MAG: hypothetical protein IKG53_07245 [Solobacterium sp.]|nr:hypothetical protein [Solobacterium sp.]